MMVRSGMPAVLIALFFACVFPATAADTPVAKDLPATLITGTVMMDAVVTAVDMEKRVVTIKLPNGDLVELLAGDDVKNLPQVRVGDVIVAEYRQALAMRLKKGSGLRSTVEDGGKLTAAPGGKPGVWLVREVDFVADVADVDRGKGLVTILGAKGRTVRMKVDDPQTLAEISKGDQVEGAYIQEMAIAVTPKTGSGSGY